MALEPAITDIEQLKSNPSLAALLAWNESAVQGAQWDRNELTVIIDRSQIREACTMLKSHAQAGMNFMCDLTCVDWFPSEPRFEVIYHLLSHARKERLRLSVRLSGKEAVVESITSVWPAADFFEREIFDLFGVRFIGHSNMRRIMMPEDWEGHPLRKDYPVEGYR
jgi:NADH-quinone oxidoreductase subunit C